ncbi:ferritin-like domain-containing protein [Blastocladiella britannica]|nr:ferritin-like domain-containing protein [Blastocladiella britannica]
MRVSILLALIAVLINQASAVPYLDRRAANNNDIGILNFALTLELLESTFYQEGLKRFPEAEMRRAGIPNANQASKDLTHVLEHELTHVKVLTSVIESLGGKPVSRCQFEFSGLSDVRSFLTTARVLEKVGVSAYTGALSSIRDKNIQTAAGTIGTVEARHSALLNALSVIDPAADAFDVPLAGNQVLTLAGPFIKQCDVDLGIKALPPLEVETATAKPGDTIRIKTRVDERQKLSCNFLFDSQSVLAPLVAGKCDVPREARGDVYLMIVKGDKGASIDNTNVIIAGPTVFSVDTFAGDSCDTITGSHNQEIRVSQKVADYEQRRSREQDDRRAREERDRKDREERDRKKQQDEAQKKNGSYNKKPEAPKPAPMKHDQKPAAPAATTTAATHAMPAPTPKA